MPQAATPPQNNPLDLRQMYYTIRERVWIIALCLLLAGLASATYLLRTPKIYAAKGVLQVELHAERPVVRDNNHCRSTLDGVPLPEHVQQSVAIHLVVTLAQRKRPCGALMLS